MRRFILLLLLVTLSLVTSGCVSREVSAYERKLPVTFQDLAGLYNLDTFQTEKCERCSGGFNLDGTREVRYKFDSGKNPQNSSVLTIDSKVEFDKSDKEATEAFHIMVKAYRVGLFIGTGGSKKLKIIEDESLFRGGDQRYCAYFSYDGQRIGNMVVVRKGEKLLSLILIGLCIDDPQSMTKLLELKLSLMDGHRISGRR